MLSEKRSLAGQVRLLQRLSGVLRSKKLFLNFGTLEGNAIDSSDSNSHLCDDSLRADALASMRPLQALAE
jgi:hypothetical protein